MSKEKGFSPITRRSCSNLAARDPDFHRGPWLVEFAGSFGAHAACPWGRRMETEGLNGRAGTWCLLRDGGASTAKNYRFHPAEFWDDGFNAEQGERGRDP